MDEQKWLEQLTRFVELPGTDLKVRIRRLPLETMIGLPARSKGLDAEDPKAIALYREVAQLGVVSPRFSFDRSDPSQLLWDDLPLDMQIAVVNAIMTISTEGREAAETAAGTFRREGEDGVRDGRAGVRPDQARVDAESPVEAAGP